ncbi:bhlh domain-containing protein [Citrus sinensis]|nr:bhlh domain-containing protein [Citrus sinensis]
MEGQSDQQKFQWLMSSKFDGNANDESHGLGYDLNQPFVAEAGWDGNQHNSLPLPQWPYSWKAPRSYIDLIAESSTFLENAIGADMLECITSPVGGAHSVYGGPEIQRELLFNNLGNPCGHTPPYGVSEIQKELLFNNLGNACGHAPAYPFFDLDASKVRFQNPYDVVESQNSNFMFFPQQILSQVDANISHQNQTLWRQEPYEECNVSQLYPRVTVAPSIYLSKQRSRVASASYRASRIPLSAIAEANTRRAERIRASQELLPHSVEVSTGSFLVLQGGHAAVVDDTIDYIKFLQSRVKGYGHYILNEQNTNEPFEEMVAELPKMNPSAARQLLESSGLYLI